MTLPWVPTVALLACVVRGEGEFSLECGLLLNGEFSFRCGELKRRGRPDGGDGCSNRLVREGFLGDGVFGNIFAVAGDWIGVGNLRGGVGDQTDEVSGC